MTVTDKESSKLPTARQLPVAADVPTMHLWLGTPAVLIFVGLGCLALSFATPMMLLVALAGVACAVLGVLTGVSKVRSARHAELVRLLGGRLLPVAGPTKVAARSWKGWRGPGVPARVRVTYGAGAPATDPRFESVLREMLAQTMGVPYLVKSHRRLTVTFRANFEKASDTDTKPADQERAERQLKRLLPGASITSVELDREGRLSALEGKHDLSVKLAAGGYPAKVEGTLNKVLAGRWRIKWDMVADTFRLELRPVFPDLVPLPLPPADVDPDPLADYADARVALAVDEDGRAIEWVPKIHPMVIVVGATGTGKTVTYRTLIFILAWLGWPVWIVDGKGTEFIGLRDWPNVQIVANSIEDQIAVIHRYHEIMEERYKLRERGMARIDQFEPMFLLIDEWADFRQNAMSWWSRVKPKGARGGPPALEHVFSIARKGRTSRNHMGIGTQRPDQEYFGGDTRDNFNMRISMGKLKPDGARMMWNSTQIGVALPRNKRGRATAVNAHDDPVEVQTYYNPDPVDLDEGSPEWEELQARKPQQTKHPRMVIVPPEEQADLDDPDGGVEALDYWAYAEAQWAWASDRPDLDPVMRAADASTDEGVHLTGAASILGLAPSAPDGGEPEDEQIDPAVDEANPRVDLTKDEPAADSPSATTAQRPRLSVVRDTPPPPEREATEPDNHPETAHAADAGDMFAGYLDQEDATVAEVDPGWLLLEDPIAEHWVTVEDIGEDPFDPDQVIISWRDDDDLDGDLSVPAGDVLTVRRPS